jgi:hypothetical protein
MPELPEKQAFYKRVENRRVRLLPLQQYQKTKQTEEEY